MRHLFASGLLVLVLLPLLAPPLLAHSQPTATQNQSQETEPLSFAKRLEQKTDVVFIPVNKAFNAVLNWSGIGGIPLIVLWLFIGGVSLTLWMKFINFRAFGHALHVVRGRYDNPNETGEVTHFQALTAALSATVGLGNIAMVAIAVSIGGPGAAFWMVIVGLFGMTAKFTECTLGQMYRKIDEDGVVSGGPMHYLRDGLKERGMARLGKTLSVLFMVLCVLASLGGGNMFQVGQSMGAISATIPALAQYGWVYGLVMAVLVGVVIIGGIKRIAHTTEKIVPFMCGIYVVAALFVLIANFSLIPTAIATIITSALSLKAGFGAFVAIMVQGIQRAVFSNEAGVGSAAIAHSAARTEEPVREGIVALLEPFIDTVLVCSMTALVIVVSGAYDNPDPAFAAARSASNGALLTSLAFRQTISWFPYVLSLAVFLFAFSTMISWSYYGERCATLMFGPGASLPYKVLFLIFTFLGSVASATQIIAFSNTLILAMSLPNLLGCYILGPKVKAALNTYMSKLKAGKFQTFP